jgi:GT2 family glycosyltransferase
MDDLRECLASLADDAARGVPVVVALNGSDDFDEAAAVAACAGVRIVRSETNGGYAAGCNLGWRAMSTDIDAVLFLNNDVVVEPGVVDALAACFEAHPDVGVSGPPVVYHDDPSRLWSLGGRLYRARGYTRLIGFGDHGLPSLGSTVDFVNGSAIAVRRELLERISGWDESYFHFWDEVDLCERARDAGYQSYVIAGPAIRHKVSASTGHRGSARFTRAQAYYFARNRARFFARRVHGLRRFTALAMQPALVAYECAQARARGNGSDARGLIEGFIDGVRGRSGQRRGGW